MVCGPLPKTLVAPCSYRFCNITAELFSKGLCSSPGEPLRDPQCGTRAPVNKPWTRPSKVSSVGAHIDSFELLHLIFVKISYSSKYYSRWMSFACGLWLLRYVNHMWQYNFFNTLYATLIRGIVNAFFAHDLTDRVIDTELKNVGTYPKKQHII